MKKHLLIAGLICVATIPPAAAVTKCVKQPSSSSSTCSGLSAGNSQSNWSATCDGVSVQGIAFCGSQDGVLTGATTDAVTTNLTSDNNKYCWCKMVSPAVSRWVYAYSDGSAGYCARNCAAYCARSAGSTASFRSALFSNLSD